MTFYQTIEAVVEYDFASQDRVDITPHFKKVWIASKTKIPVLGHITLGNMKEPFSLEELTSNADITFMERSLPVDVFSPSYNLGLKFNNTALNDRITWAAGVYWNTQDLNYLYRGGDFRDQFSTANGYSLAARVTGLPWYEEGGKGLLHLGISYNFRARNKNKEGAEEKFGSRPESYLTGDKLVDSGKIAANRTNLFNGEFAWVWGPFSLQGEYIHAFTNAKGDPDFWGCYMYCSFVLTGEHRMYNTAGGVFTDVKPRREFNPFKGGWGAWELGARISYVDLNSRDISGGREANLTFGLNWYLNPNLRLMFNYIRAHLEDRAKPPIDNGYASIIQARFQINF